MTTMTLIRWMPISGDQQQARALTTPNFTDTRCIQPPDIFHATASYALLRSALRHLLVRRQEGHPACKKAACCFVDGDDLPGALHVLQLQLQLSPAPPSSLAHTLRMMEVLVCAWCMVKRCIHSGFVKQGGGAHLTKPN